MLTGTSGQWLLPLPDPPFGLRNTTLSTKWPVTRDKKTKKVFTTP